MGIGQRLRGDDVAGLAAVRLWRDTYPQVAQMRMVQVELLESPGINLLNRLEDADAAVLVDAVISGAKPGTLHLLSGRELQSFHDGAGSAHGWGIAETLALGQKLDPEMLPKTMVIIGIEAGQVTPGVGLSQEVEAVLTDTARLIQDTITSLMGRKIE